MSFRYMGDLANHGEESRPKPFKDDVSTFLLLIAAGVVLLASITVVAILFHPNGTVKVQDQKDCKIVTLFLGKIPTTRKICKDKP